MTDIELAKAGLKDHTVCLVRDGNMLTGDRRGIAPLLDFIESKADFTGYSAADKVVGKAAAMLYVCMKVKEVYAEVLSRPALDVFCRYGIVCRYGVMTDYIINRAGNGICPMEQTVRDLSDPQEAPEALKEQLRKMKQRESQQ